MHDPNELLVKISYLKEREYLHGPLETPFEKDDEPFEKYTQQLLHEESQFNVFNTIIGKIPFPERVCFKIWDLTTHMMKNFAISNEAFNKAMCNATKNSNYKLLKLLNLLAL